MLLEPTGRLEVARLPSLARTRGDSAARLQRRVGNDGADKWGPPVSGSDETARSDASASGLGGAESLRGAVALGRERRDAIGPLIPDRTAQKH